MKESVRPTCAYCNALILRSNLLDLSGEVLLYADQPACRPCWAAFNEGELQ